MHINTRNRMLHKIWDSHFDCFVSNKLYSPTYEHDNNAYHQGNNEHNTGVCRVLTGEISPGNHIFCKFNTILFSFVFDFQKQRPWSEVITVLIQKKKFLYIPNGAV